MPVRLLAVIALATLSSLACNDPPTTAPDFPAGLLASTALPDCGFENEAACAPHPTDLRCDYGLEVDTRGTPLNLGDDRCINHTRHQVGAQFRGTWADWALANQRTLGIDEPFSWVMHLVTHNANNNLVDTGTTDPNQVWSLSDQLDLGSRGLWLDLHWVLGDVRLCHALVNEEHGPETHFGCSASDRRFAYAAREIADWLEKNPGEIVWIDPEHYLEGNQDVVIDALQTYFGNKIYRSRDPQSETSPWPSRRELRAQGKQLIVGVVGTNPFGTLVHKDYKPAALAITNIIDMRVERTDGIVTGCMQTASDSVEKDLVDYVYREFRLIGEDRTIFSHGRYGYTSGSDVADQAACNIKLISLDLLGASLYNKPLANPRPSELRQPYAVWSWAEGDRGNGHAALLRGATGRWNSRSEGEQHRFACAELRSETTRDPTLWLDKLGRHWRITSRTGAWREGGRACLEEFGAEGFVFSVPVNGYMNGQLRLQDETRGDLWLNYNSLEGGWRINQRPTANAGADLTVECAGHNGTPVQLDGRQSADPDQHALTHEWRGPFGTATGPNPTVLLPVGRHEVTLLVDDGFSGAALDTVVVNVVDTTPPEIRSALATPNTLWAPNHAMVPVAITVDVSDACDAQPTCRIVSVASSEAAQGAGSGNAAPDWRITGALTLELRAERSAKGAGRVYTIEIECRDGSGNAARRVVFVTVPHDRR